MTIIRYPTRDYPAELDEHEASFDADEGELVAGLGRLNADADALVLDRIVAGTDMARLCLDNLATPAADPVEPFTPEPLPRVIVGLILGTIAVASLAALAHFL